MNATSVIMLSRLVHFHNLRNILTALINVGLLVFIWIVLVMNRCVVGGLGDWSPEALILLDMRNWFLNLWIVPMFTLLCKLPLIRLHKLSETTPFTFSLCYMYINIICIPVFTTDKAGHSYFDGENYIISMSAQTSTFSSSNSRQRAVP